MDRRLKVFEIVDKVVVLILQNERFVEDVSKRRSGELIEVVAERFGVSLDTAWRYVREARSVIHGYRTRDKAEWFQSAVRRKELLYRTAMERGDYKSARIIDKDLCELLDLYPDKRIKQETTTYDIDLGRLTAKGLERIRNGDDPKDVVLDPECLRHE